jgi:quinol monooxygenase YgiN
MGPIAGERAGRKRVSRGSVNVIVTTTSISVQPEKRRELFQTISALIEQINEAQGCVMFHHYIDASDENSSLLMAEWETDSDLNNYQRSSDFAVLRGAITMLSTRCTDFRALVISRESHRNQ